MKILPFIWLLLLSLYISAQKPADILATSTGITFTADSLSPDGRKVYLGRDKLLAESRNRLLYDMVTAIVLDREAKSRNQPPEALIKAEIAKVPDPSPAAIKAVFDTNQSTIGGRSLNEVKGEIVAYLRREPEEKALAAFIDSLKEKYKVSYLKDVNVPGLRPLESLVKIDTRTISVQEFEEKNRLALSEVDFEIYEELRDDLQSSVFSALVAAEAKAKGQDVGEFIGAEITDKLRAYTDEERAELELELLKRLQTKYNVKYLLRSPTPIVQNISVDDDPAVGPTAAPVTIVMFTDFQCPACSRTHPMLRKVIAEYGSNVRLVIRDFPLQQIHENAFEAARAANAANAQGKFLEYIELLYKNQDDLDKAHLIAFAEQLGLNVKQFEIDFNSERSAAEINKDIADGKGYGAGGTPTIFVNGIRVYRISTQGFRDAIDLAMKK